MRFVKLNEPMETNAVIDFSGFTQVNDLNELFRNTTFKAKINENEIIIEGTLKSSDSIYGLGEQMGGINKRGRMYNSFCTDDPNHTPDKNMLYGAHNFFVLDSETFPVGLFIDFPSKIDWDMGYSHKDKLKITVHGTSAKLYLIEGLEKQVIVEKFLKSIGPSFLPPRWAFGYQQSRWSYENHESVEEVYKNFEENELPLDAIYLDIDYMSAYKNFTVDDNRFPDFKNFIQGFKNRGVRLVPIIDAGCKIEAGYPVYEEGVESGYYCVDKNNQPFVGAVWPGLVHYPDFLNPEAQKWFGKKYHQLLDLGIEGFWNDMNEPSIFYTKDSLSRSLEKSRQIKDHNLDIHGFFELKDSFSSISNHILDYQSMYHKYQDRLVSNYDVHNLYGYYMTKAASEGFETYDDNKRFLLFSRASYVGMHRYGGIWTGDNHSWWEHLLLNIKMMPSLNMCGFLYSGADVGGFGGNCDHELLIRWSQFALFTPLFRNHACMGTRHQEPYAFDSWTLETMKNILDFRYSMVHYLYSEFMKVNERSKLLFKPLAFKYKDEISKNIEDQLLFSDSLMLTPIYNQNSENRNVYLPEKMMAIHMKGPENYELKLVEAGHHYERILKDQWLFYILKDQMLILTKAALRTNALETKALYLIAYVDTVAKYELYLDDGITKKSKVDRMSISVAYRDQILIFDVKGYEGCESIHYDIMTSDKKRHKGVYYV
jgi:alpha-glucosidase